MIVKLYALSNLSGSFACQSSKAAAVGKYLGVDFIAEGVIWWDGLIGKNGAVVPEIWTA